MIRTFDHNQLLRFRRQRDQRFQPCPRTKLIARSAHKQFRPGAAAQKIKRVGTRRFRVGGDGNRRNTHANHRLHSRIRTCCAQSHGCAEGESRENHGQMKLSIQPVESRVNIFDFAVAMIVLPVTESGAAKIETQYGKTKTVQRFHSVKHNLIVQGPAKQRMRMADERRVRRGISPGVEQRFQSSRWTFKKK